MLYEVITDIDALHRLSVDDLEPRAQRFMTFHDAIECRLQGGFVQLTLQKQRAGQVVGGTGAFSYNFV